MTDDRPTYEYATHQILGKSQDQITALLQAFGSDGFKLVAIYHDFIIMEREK